LAWKINYTATALRQLRKLDQQISRRIVDTMSARAGGSGNPRIHGKALKGELGDIWCYRVGDYRVLCDLQDKILTILVLQIGNRREIYRP
jgi:mRNA interferase RelE/StbE